MSGSLRHSHWVAFALLLASWIAAVGVAMATEPTKLDLPAQELSLSLMQFGRVIGVEIEFTPESVRGKKAAAIKGYFDRDQALRQLLRGTGLSYRTTPQGVIVVEASAHTNDSNETSKRADPPGAPESVQARQVKESQPAEQTPIGSLAEIVVTAEKRESTVQKVPLSLTAISAAQIAAQGLTRLEDIAAETPGISMKQFSPGQTEYEMRGLPSSGGSMATVGLYVNDVPMAASANSFLGKSAIDPDLYDMQRVEVLRGPQGTLYGAGSMGGTIKLITTPPNLTGFAASAQSDLSDTAHGGVNWGASAMLNLPLIDDVLALRVVATDKYNPGFIDLVVVNPFPYGTPGDCGWSFCTRGAVTQAPVVSRNDNLNWERVQGGRAALRFHPNDRLTVDLLTLYQAISLGALSQADVSSVGVNALASYVPNPGGDGYADTFKLTSLTVGYGLGFAVLALDSGYWIHDASWSTNDTENAFVVLNTYYDTPTAEPIAFYNRDHVSQFSQEVRLTSSGDGRFQWVAGGFLSDFKDFVAQYIASPAYAYLSTGGAAANPNGISYENYLPYRMDQYALFGEASYRLTDAWKATVGVRAFRYNSHLYYWQAGIFTESGNLTPTAGSVDGKNSSGANPKFNLAYEPTPDLTLYTEIAKGFRTGGVNLPAPAALCPKTGPLAYGPDSIWDYEIGEKARLLDERLQVNADVFYIRWNDVQQALDLPCSYPFTANIGNARSYGPEFEVTGKLTNYVSVSLSGSYTNTHVTSINQALLGNTIGATEPLTTSMPILNVPKLSGSAALDVAYPVSNQFTATMRVSATVVSSFYDIDYYVQQLPGYAIVDLRLGLVGGPWAAYLYAHNLTDKIAELTIDTHDWTSPIPSQQTAAVTTPRTVGAELNYTF